MSNLQLSLLGPWQLHLAGQPITRLPTAKLQALLAYLAVEATTAHSRDALIGLFWADFSPASARQNLRKTLQRLRQTIPPHYLLVTNQTIQFDPTSDFYLDVAEFTQLLVACRHHTHSDSLACAACAERLHSAVNLYRGDFLAHFFVEDSPAFEEWLLLKREWLRREVLQALYQLAAYHEGQGDYDRAYRYAWHQVELDPLREEAHQQLMRALALSDRRSEALAQYETCRRILANELAVEPAQATNALYDQIRLGTFPVATAPNPAVRTEQPTGQLPAAPPHPLATLTPAQAEIRMVTVLCVGLHRTTQVQQVTAPEETAQRVQQLLQLLEKVLTPYAARVDRLLSHSLIILFGAAQTHEDDPERAIRAALEIRQVALRADMLVSASVNTGPIYLGPIASPLAPLVAALGPVINLAEELQVYAEPAQILAGEATYQQTAASFLFTPQMLHLRNTEALRVYAVNNLHPHPQKTRGLPNRRAALIGRAAEMNRLTTILAALQQGQGCLLTVSGEAGVGKSRLIYELKQSPISNLPSSILWLEGRCQELGMTTGYWPVLDLLRTYFAGRAEAGATDNGLAAQIVVALDNLALNGALTVTQTEEIGPLLGNLLAVQFGNIWDERLRSADPQQVRHRTLLALRDFFVGLTQRQPVVILFEDIHWADELSLNLITLLMEALVQHPLLLVCVYRPAEAQAMGRLATLAMRKCPEHFVELHLRELPPSQSQALVAELLTGALIAPAIQQLILEKAQGNPLFVEEMIRTLLDAEVLYCRNGDWQLRQSAPNITVPTTIQGVILRRVDWLDATTRQILQRAAVLGRLFQRRVLAQMLPVALELESNLTMLMACDLIYQERVVPEVEYSFKHALVQEAVYGTLPRSQREQFHQQVGEALEQLYAGNLMEVYELLAYHYGRSTRVSKAIAYLLRAGEKACSAYLNEAAIGYFQQALAKLKVRASSLPPAEMASASEGQQLEGLVGLGKAYWGNSKILDAEACFRQAIALGHTLALAGPPLARLYHWLGETLYWQWDKQGWLC